MLKSGWSRLCLVAAIPLFTLSVVFGRHHNLPWWFGAAAMAVTALVTAALVVAVWWIGNGDWGGDSYGR